MSLKKQIEADLKTALLGGDRFASETLRGLKASILDEEVASGKREEGLADEVIERIVVREVKKRNESASIYQANDRLDLAEAEKKEIDVISKYLPSQMSQDELAGVVRAKISELGTTSPKDIGRVIGAIKKELGNKADGTMLATIVKEQLEN